MKGLKLIYNYSFQGLEATFLGLRLERKKKVEL